MDNLDRTNVAQAAFAKWTLNKQLQALGIFNETETVETYDELLKDLRERMCPRKHTETFVLTQTFDSLDRSCQRNCHGVHRHGRAQD